MKLYQRLITIAAATVAGLAGTIALGSPASADGPPPDTSPFTITITAEAFCLPDGSQLIDWNIKNDRVSQAATITALTLLPAGTTLDGPEVGDVIAGNATSDGNQIVPAGETSASLSVTANWPDIEGPGQTDETTLALELETCTPLYTVTQDCAGITFTFPAVDDGGEFPPDPIDVSLIPSTGDSQIFQLKGGDPEKKVTFAGSAGLTVDLSYGDDFKTTYPWTSAPCPVPDLPKTGSSLTGPAVIGGSLLLVGILLVVGSVLFRRRRSVTSV